tara:strand:+ start:2583 stop:6164 length:3582 start_codon:yes stop_codon:yes gene_type:complete
MAHKNFVVVIDIADAEILRNRRGRTKEADSYREQVILEVSEQLQKFCSAESKATLANRESPFVVEISEVKNLLNFSRILIGNGKSGLQVVPEGATEPINFYIGISTTAGRDNEDEFRGVPHADALAAKAGPNQIYIEEDVAESLASAEMGELEILFLGRQQLLKERKPTRIFELRSTQHVGQSQEDAGEIVRLSLVVIDILHSTDLKPLMGSSPEERLENYERQILVPFRAHTNALAKKYKGKIVDQTGDACFLSFEDPHSARQWATELLDPKYDIEAPEGYDYPQVRYHLSIDSGKVRRNASGRLQGSFVDRVHRLNDLSQDNQIILSPSVAHLIEDDLGDPKVYGKVFRHKSYSLKGIVKEVEVWEYCPPGVEPRLPRLGKGQNHLKPAALAAVSNGESIQRFSDAIQEALELDNGKEATLPKEEARTTRIFAFDRVEDGVGFVIDVFRATGGKCGGAVHFGLINDKENGPPEGSAVSETLEFLPDPELVGAIRLSGAARTHVGEWNRRFKVEQMKGARVMIQDRSESVFEVMPRLRTRYRLAMLAAMLVLVVLASFSLFDQTIRQPIQRQQALFVSLAPALDGQSWWFEVSPWFTPEIRKAIYDGRKGKKQEIEGLKQSILDSKKAPEFYRTLQEKWLPEDGEMARQLQELGALMDDRKSYDKEKGRSACYDIITDLIEKKGKQIRATDWHLIANLLTSLKPSPDEGATDSEFQSKYQTALSAFDGRENDYDRAIFAFRTATELYRKEEKQGRDNSRILTGLRGLCYSDWARLYYYRRKFDVCLDPLFSAVEALDYVREFRFLHAYVLAFRGECKTRSKFDSNASENSLVDKDPNSAVDDFDSAMSLLRQCFEAVSFQELIVERDVTLSAGNHLLAAVINQFKAHYYLENWELRKSEEMSANSIRIRELIDTVAQLSNLNADPDSERENEGEGIYLEVCQEYIRCHLLQALAAHYSGNAYNADRALTKAIHMSTNAQEKRYLGSVAWRESLPNFHERRADYHLFISGDLKRASIELEAAISNAEFLGWDQENHPMNRFYLGYQYRLLWTAEMMSKRELDPRGMVADMPNSLYFQTASAFSKPGGEIQSLFRIIEAREEFETITRDDRQVLLFICEYLLLDSVAIGEAQAATVNGVYERLAEPWKKGGPIDSVAYLDDIRNRAASLKERLSASRLSADSNSERDLRLAFDR